MRRELLSLAKTICLLSLGLLSNQGIAKADDGSRIYPFHVESSPPDLPGYYSNATRYILDKSRFWKPGQKLRCAFYGGTKKQLELVEQVASTWTKHANLTFSFRDDNNNFRQWSPDDFEYQAEIRIMFAEAGLWSALGTDSINPKVFHPGKCSMNLDLDGLPENEMRTSILHEFGHALGFLHEHQRPDGFCSKEFRWDDDSGYVKTTNLAGMLIEDKEQRRPGVYSWLTGPPNKFTKEWAELNMKRLPRSKAYIEGKPDRLSVMNYHFPEFFYKEGSESPCYKAMLGDLSELDKKGASIAYPRE